MEELKKQYLSKAENLMKEFTDSNEVNRIPEIVQKILRGEVSPSEDISSFLPKRKVTQFISSTFEDTQFEQDYMLKEYFPFMKQFCDVLGLDFDVVTMRWGVRARANNDHKTTEMCMEELYNCLNESAGLAYIALQSHRYGFQPFPRVIESNEFEAIKRALVNENVEIFLLESPYWKLNTSGSPFCYELQPVASIPGFEKYLISDDDKCRMKEDEAFKKDRFDLRSEVSAAWWGVFESIQSQLRKGVLLVARQMQEDENS